VWGDVAVGGLSAVATVYNLLLPAAVAWCGALNRFGNNCVLYDVDAQYPGRLSFAAAKACAVRFRFPVALWYGVPTPPPPIIGGGGGDDNNRGIQVVLFRPGTGETSRAHFCPADLQSPTPRMALAVGELSDA
jgi:hypothetical protein